MTRRAAGGGRGFAVVADEVRKLAERIASSTAQIAAVISMSPRNRRNAAMRFGSAAGGWHNT